MVAYRILHCADLHLDSPFRGIEADPDAPADRIRGATRAAFTKLVDFALEQGVAIVLIAGDLYDGDWEDWRTGQFLVRELERLTGAGIHVVAISGNHDAENVITKKLHWPKGPRARAILLSADFVQTELFPELNLAVHGRSFRNKAERETLLPYPERLVGMLNIGLLHTSASKQKGVHECYAPCKPEELAAHEYDYWALGHIHERQTLGENPWIVFPGNLQGRHINEEGDKGATLITVENGAIVGPPSHHALDVVRWCKIPVDLSGAGDEEAAFALIRHKIALALEAAGDRLIAARVELTGPTPAHAKLMFDPAATREKIRGEALALGGAGRFWLEQVMFNTKLPQAAADRDPMVSLLLDAIENPDLDASLFAPELQAYAGQLLDRAAGLRDELDRQPSDDQQSEHHHPATDAAAGKITSAMLSRARALLLAKLGT